MRMSLKKWWCLLLLILCLTLARSGCPRKESCTADESPCSSLKVRKEIEDTITCTWPYMDKPSLRGTVASIQTIEPANVPFKKNVCKVTYRTSDSEEDTRMYAFDRDDLCDWKISATTLPYETLKWCMDPKCRGHVE